MAEGARRRARVAGVDMDHDEVLRELAEEKIVGARRARSGPVVTRASRRQPSAEQEALFPSSASEEVAPRPARILKITPADRPAGEDQPHHVDPASAFLTALEVIARYGWGRTKGYRMLRSEGFPRPIGGDRYRLDTLIAWENAQLAAGRRAKPVPSLPPRKRVRAS